MRQSLMVVAALQYLASKSGSLDADTKNMLQQEKLELFETTVLHKYTNDSDKLGGTQSITEIIAVDNKKQYGISTFDKRQLSQDFVVRGLRFGYSGEASGVKLGSRKYVNTSAGVPGELQNSEIEIVQDGKVVMHVPVSRLLVPASSTSNQGNETIFEAFAFLKRGKDIEIFLKTPGEIDAGAGNHNAIAIEFLGFSLRTRSVE